MSSRSMEKFAQAHARARAFMFGGRPGAPDDFSEKEKILPRARNALSKEERILHRAPANFLQEMKTLMWLNLCAAVLHVGVATSILAIGLRRGASIRMRALYLPTQAWDVATKSLVPSYGQPRTRFELPVAVALFSVISACFHITYAMGSTWMCGHFYWEFMLDKRGNPLRWLEYFWSASLMMGLVAYSFGTTDIDLLFSVSSLIAVTMLFGHVTEREAVRSPSANWLTGRLYYHWLGWVPMVLAWIPVTRRFADAVRQSGGDTPSFVIAIFVVELILFSCFSVVQVWHMYEVDAANMPTLGRTLKAETVMLILSFVSKTSLAFLSAAMLFF